MYYFFLLDAVFLNGSVWGRLVVYIYNQYFRAIMFSMRVLFLLLLIYMYMYVVFRVKGL